MRIGSARSSPGLSATCAAPAPGSSRGPSCSRRVEEPLEHPGTGGRVLEHPPVPAALEDLQARARALRCPAPRGVRADAVVLRREQAQARPLRRALELATELGHHGL